jgi:chromosomal replication initiator protein
MEFYQKLWNDILDILSKNLSESAFEETFGESKKVVKEENSVVYVLCPSTFIKSKINSLYLKNIHEILSTLTTKRLKFKFVCENEIQTKPVVSFSHITTNNLNPQYTFESLVVGESNRFAYLSAMKVAEQPGVFINPLYIFGGVGLGKTHLMHAIGNFICDNDINSKILYVQAKDFIMDYSKATQTKNMAAFYEKYENLDVLLVDDIQMLAIGKISQ